MSHLTVLTLQGALTGLYGASQGGKLNIAQYLLDRGADVNQLCDVSNICLHNNYLLIIFHTILALIIRTF